MELDLQAVRENARRAATEDLLDRATIYRDAMEPAALALIEAELEDRGLGRDDLINHAHDRDQENLIVRDGVAVRCSFCDRPAVAQGVSWHKLWGRLPVFPRRFFYCARHRAAAEERTGDEAN